MSSHGRGLRIVVDATDIGADMYPGGIYQYIVNLFSCLRDLDAENRYTVLFNYFRRRHAPACREVMARLAGPNMRIRLSRLPRPLMRRLRLPVNLFTGDMDILHGPFDRLLPARGCRKVVTIHDLRAFDFAEALAGVSGELAGDPRLGARYRDWAGWVGSMRDRVSAAVEAADRIITVSAFSRDSLVRHTGARPDSIHVVYNGIAPRFRPIEDRQAIRGTLQAHGIGGDYLLFVGHLDPLKNVLRLLDAYGELRRSLPARRVPGLVLVTPTPPHDWFRGVVDARIARGSLGAHVRCLHGLASETLPLLYGGATACLLPSLYEGFGLPVVEAMACGTPVLASNVCSLPEVAGGAALLVDPCSTAAIADGMARLLTDDALRADLIARGLERARRFSWQETARETLKVYASAMGQPGFLYFKT